MQVFLCLEECTEWMNWTQWKYVHVVDFTSF